MDGTAAGYSALTLMSAEMGIERTFSPAWREAAAFLHTTIVATPTELTELTHAIQQLLAAYAPSARAKPRGARTVTLSVRGVPKP